MSFPTANERLALTKGIRTFTCPCTSGIFRCRIEKGWLVLQLPGRLAGCPADMLAFCVWSALLFDSRPARRCHLCAPEGRTPLATPVAYGLAGALALCRKEPVRFVSVSVSDFSNRREIGRIGGLVKSRVSDAPLQREASRGAPAARPRCPSRSFARRCASPGRWDDMCVYIYIYI